MSLDDKFDEDTGKIVTLVKRSIETMSTLAVYIAETLRAEYVHPQFGFRGLEIRAGKIPNPGPTIKPGSVNPLLYSVLQHSGNFFEGYALTCFSYVGLSVLPSDLSEKTKMVASIFLSNSFVFAVESGWIWPQKPDYWDIPAATAGSLAFLGFHKFVEKLPELLMKYDDFKQRRLDRKMKNISERYK